MKKLVPVLMMFMAAFMFFSCDDKSENNSVVYSDISLSDATKTVAEGGTFTLTATTTPAGGTVVWSTSDATKATVDGGVVTGVAVTTTAVTIKATIQGTGIEASCAVTVVPNFTGISLDKATHSMAANETVTLTATTTPAGGSVVWATSDATKATVAGGVVTGKATGEVTISASIQGSAVTAATCVITLTTPTKNYLAIEGETLVHYTPIFAGTGDYGNDAGITNNDGTYTFNGTAGNYSGGGGRYEFPTDATFSTAPWNLDDYDIVTLHFTVTGGSVNAISKKVGRKEENGNAMDVLQYPTGNQYPALSASTTTLSYAKVEAFGGVGYQRSSGGPATVKVDKVVFSKGTIHTITFNGGDFAAMQAIAPIKIITGRTVNFENKDYLMPAKPLRPGYTFVRWYNTTDSEHFNPAVAITKDLVLSAEWFEGEPEPVDMSLNLDSTTWEDMPEKCAPNQSNNVNWPEEFAETEYDSDTGVLTVTFDGRNRQRAIFPLNEEQIQALIDHSGPVTFRIEATYENGDPSNSDLMYSANFRCHLGDPEATQNWNGTNTGNQTEIKLVEVATFNSKAAANLAYFIIQAMFWDTATSADNTMVADYFAPVVFKITSIKVELGDTTEED